MDNLGYNEDAPKPLRRAWAQVDQFNYDCTRKVGDFYLRALGNRTFEIWFMNLLERTGKEWLRAQIDSGDIPSLPDDIQKAEIHTHAESIHDYIGTVIHIALNKRIKDADAKGFGTPILEAYDRPIEEEGS